MFARLGGSRHVLVLTGAAAAWGLATVISKRAVAEIPPLTLLPLQLAISVSALLAAGGLRRLRGSWSPELRRLGGLGLLNPGLAYTLSLLGLGHITASLSVVLWAVEPVVILLLAWGLLRERIGRSLALTTAAALAGVVLIVFTPGTGSADGAAVGVALTLAGVAACAAYTVICRRLLADDATLTVVMVQQACALAFACALFAVGQLLGAAPSGRDVSGGAWLSAAVSGVLYYAVGFWLYLTGLRRVPAMVAGLFINLIPVFGIAGGYLLLDERLTTRQWIGAAAVIAAVCAATLLRPKPDDPTATSP
jgi:drug/metabolite transporter (DMT)-like permease